MSPDSTYDIIFARGGTAACVTAGRLAGADPSSLIMAGRDHVVKPSEVSNGHPAQILVMYTRAAALDWDDRRKQGNPAWGLQGLIPVSNKVSSSQTPATGGNSSIQRVPQLRYLWADQDLRRY
ncbi:hypothetical protein MPER_06719 [Moniliophthora perniciosa FA553]|nr:hypothetical protein MPER_06719 [Moniliophthora perniciosa FA553]